jgi:general secretion pathway protein G
VTGNDWRLASARRSETGFTLLELLVVMSLIAVLSGIAMVQYTTSVQRAREAVLREDLFRMRDAIDQYYADKGKWPASLDALVTDKYLRDVPEDPMTGARDSWQTVAAEPEPGNATAEPGIYDVKSGSDRSGIDGTSYAEW